MSFGSGCAIAIGILFIVFGGCTFIVFMPSAHNDDAVVGLPGLAVVIAGVAIIALAVRQNRRRNRGV